MAYLCSFPSCSHNAELFCQCEDSEPSFCKPHFFEHLQLDYEKPHKPQAFSCKMRANDVVQLMSIKTTLRASLVNVRERILRSFDEVIIKSYNKVRENLYKVCEETEKFLVEIDEAITSEVIPWETSNSILAGLRTNREFTLGQLRRNREVLYED